MLVYDVTNTSTFESLVEWLERSRAALASADRRPSYALVANKIDMEHLRVIKSDRHHKFAQDNGLLTYAVSAKTGEGVNLCLQKIAADLLGGKTSRLTLDSNTQHSRNTTQQAGAGAAADGGEGRDSHLQGVRPAKADSDQRQLYGVQSDVISTH